MRWRDRHLFRPYRFFLRNWWVVVFCVLTWVFYLGGLEKKKGSLMWLYEKKERFERKKEEALVEGRRLLLRKQCQNDPEWLELVLKEKLGVVLKDEIKVVYDLVVDRPLTDGKRE